MISKSKLAIFVSISASVLLATFVVAAEADEISNEICETPGCVNTASWIVSNMNTSIDPCDDFYEFACGNFLNKTIIKVDEASVSIMRDTHKNIQEQIRAGLEKEVSDNDPRTFKLLHTFYNACMNIEQIEKNSEDDFRKIMETLGGWPVLQGESWDESSFDWKKFVYESRKIGFVDIFFIALITGEDFENNNRNMLQLDQPYLGILINSTSRVDDKRLQAYLKYMIDVAEVFGADRNKAKDEFTEVLHFLIELANITLPMDKYWNLKKALFSPEQYHKRKSLFTPLTIDELQSKYPGLPWLEYINEQLKSVVIDANEKVVVVVPTYFESLFQLIDKTPKRVLANYMMWQIAYDSIPFMSSRINKASQDYYRSFINITSGAFGDINSKAYRSRMCISCASGKFDLAVSALYVSKYFDVSTKASVVEMEQNIRQTFHKILDKSDWINEETRTAALEKLDTIKSYIAYPDEILDGQKLDDFYKDLEMYSGSFLNNSLNIHLFHLNLTYKEIKTPRDPTSWIYHGNAVIVNAYYSLLENYIKLPASLLQGLFYSNDRPQYLNYAAIGNIIGHEIIHGFQTMSQLEDTAVEANLTIWRDPESKNEYVKRAKCFVDQYNNYTVNGSLTERENIADNSGIREVYETYSNWQQQNGQEPRLPGLPYTSKQMFWITAANIWCDKHRAASLNGEMHFNMHSPAKFRVIGPMSNMPEFAKDFNCPLGSKMNPVQKCKIW